VRARNGIAQNGYFGQCRAPAEFGHSGHRVPAEIKAQVALKWRLVSQLLGAGQVGVSEDRAGSIASLPGWNRSGLISEQASAFRHRLHIEFTIAPPSTRRLASCSQD
jgi:hypothetical protein